jgi:hypothetical protein
MIITFPMQITFHKMLLYELDLHFYKLYLLPQVSLRRIALHCAVRVPKIAKQMRARAEQGNDGNENRKSWEWKKAWKASKF